MLFILAILYLVLTQVLGRQEGVHEDMIMMAFGFAIVLFVTYVVSEMVQKKIRTINEYLIDCSNVEQLPENRHFVTKEFDEINKNLIKVLKKAKKREDDKQKYNTKLKLKSRQRSEMLSAIAHEFRNPISAIIGYSQTLHEDQDISRPLQEKFLTKIYRNGQKIEELLSRLILWNKFESGEAKLRQSSFDILSLAKDTRQSFEDKYRDRSIRIEGESSTITADRALIEVVLRNLIENALKYSKEEVRVRIEGNKVSVIDRGIGIRQKEIGKVTKKFYRSGTHSWDNSMGLGLSIVKTILSLHDAKLEIRSVEDEGSTFSFYLY
ncbi:MAG: HAMP domain-containing sensor histidine kinase [Campylobacterota bacterium]|nr:HAMP domain-containing sensor histidine kinase [Campylobacterota bacterium]